MKNQSTKDDGACVSADKYPCHNPSPASTVQESMPTHPYSGGCMNAREVIATNDGPKPLACYFSRDRSRCLTDLDV